MNQSNKAIKAGIWYTLSNVAIRGINFLTIPIFARLLSTENFGAFSNFSAWLTLLTTLVTLDLYVTIARARFDFKDELDSYIFSVQLLGTGFTLICYSIVIALQDFFTEILSMDMVYVHSIFLYLLVYPAFQLLQAKHRQFMQYKSFVGLTALSVIFSTICSLGLVVFAENQLFGRIIGYIFPLFSICLILYIFNAAKARFSFKIKHWKYALPIAVPLIPHVLSGNILGTSDQALITYFCGSEQTAFYSIAYSCSLIVIMLGNSINQAWSPWLYERLNAEDYNKVKTATRKYLFLAISAVSILMLFSPEIVFIMGGASYAEVVNIMPPIMLGCFFWCLYTHFVNVEIFEKKTLGISVRTVITALLNIVLNILLIPIFGYQAAAYTTLFSYVVLFLMHAKAAKKLGASQYYDLKFFAFVACLSVVIMLAISVVVQFFLVRIIIIAILVLIISAYAFAKRKTIANNLSIFLRPKK